MERILPIIVITSIILFTCLQAFGQAENLTQPKVWLKFNPDSLELHRWKDVSGNSNHASIPSGNTGTEYFNFNPARNFKSSDATSTIPYSVEGLSEITFMTVYQAADTTERGITGTQDAIARQIKITTNSSLGPDSIMDAFSHNGKYITLSTISQSWAGLTADGGTAKLSLASIPGDEGIKGFEGAIAEYLVFDEALPFLDRIKWETYLAIKYGITLKEKNYVSSDDQVLWSAEDNIAYSTRITALGRDDKFLLHQKQAVSHFDTTALLLMHVGEMAEKNADNKAALADKDFFVWGDNEKQLDLVKGEGQDSILMLLSRKWLIQVRGNSAQKTFTTLRIDLTQIPYNSLGYWLVIDRSVSNDFSVDNLEYFEPDSISADSTAFFRILWDVDNSGKDNFTLARMQPLFSVAHTLDQPLCTEPETGRVMVKVIKGQGPYNIEWGLEGAEEKQHEQAGDSVIFEKLQAGTYNLQIQDASGSVFQRSMTLEMANELIVNLGPDQKLEMGKEINLDASLYIPDTVEVNYRWESSFGTTSSSPKLNIVETGIYSVYITNQANDCVFSDEIVISGSPIERITAFPNPITNNKLFSISISLKEVSDVEVRLMDMQGTVHDLMIARNSAEYQFKTSLPTSGVYLIRVDTPEGTTTKKVIVY